MCFSLSIIIEKVIHGIGIRKMSNMFLFTFLTFCLHMI